MSQSTKKDTFIYILTLCYLIPLAGFLIVNTFFSLTQTTYMELYLDTEKPLYKADSPLILLILGTAFLLLCGYLFQKWEISHRLCSIIERITLIYVAVICLIIVFLFRATVACDSGFLSDIAIAFLGGDYSSLTGDGYLVHYPHQLGMIAFLQLIYFLFGIENYTLLQFFNIIAIIAVIYYLHRITRELFDDNRIQLMLSMLCLGMLPLYLYAVFIYGDIPGLGLAVPSVYYAIRYLNSQQKILLIPAFLCMTFAIIFKSNNTVILAAIVIILLLHTIRKRDWFALIFAAVIMIGPTIGSSCIDAYYANAAGLDEIPSGIPKIAWVAMGLQENDYLENGWYNSYNWATYTQYDHDARKTAEASVDSIKNSLQSFLSAPKSSGLAFFYRKFISQWNDPGYQAQLTVEWYSRHRDDQSPLALYLIYGNGRFLLEGFMNLYHFLILLGASAFVIQSIRRWSLSGALLSLCVFGGYFFHTFWEAAGRYGLGYFVLCAPMSACGLCAIIKVAHKFLHERLLIRFHRNA